MLNSEAAVSPCCAMFLVLIGAMPFGCAEIATEVGATSKVLQSQVDGWLVTAGNVYEPAGSRQLFLAERLVFAALSTRCATPKCRCP